MKNKKIKALRVKLFAAIKQVLEKDHQGGLTNRSEKAVKKSIKRIVKKTTERNKSVPAPKAKRKVVHSRKFQLDGVTA